MMEKNGKVSWFQEKGGTLLQNSGGLFCILLVDLLQVLYNIFVFPNV